LETRYWKAREVEENLESSVFSDLLNRRRQFTFWLWIAD
jgi:hypothetical protein